MSPIKLDHYTCSFKIFGNNTINGVFIGMLTGIIVNVFVAPLKISLYTNSLFLFGVSITLLLFIIRSNNIINNAFKKKIEKSYDKVENEVLSEVITSCNKQKRYIFILFAFPLSTICGIILMFHANKEFADITRKEKKQLTQQLNDFKSQYDKISSELTKNNSQLETILNKLKKANSQNNELLNQLKTKMNK